VHESPFVMTGPLWGLALGSILAGFLGVPYALGHYVGLGNGIEHWLEPVFEPAHAALQQVFSAPAPSHATEYLLMLASIGVAVGGILLAGWLYKGGPAGAAALARSLAPAHRVLLNKYWVDELYGALFVRGLALGGGQAMHAMDRFVIDGGDGQVRAGLGVNGAAWATRDLLARFSDLWDRWVVDGTVSRSASSSTT